MKNREKLEKRLRRKKRVRSKVKGTGVRPRVSVFRSNRHLFVQVIDDTKGNTLVSAGDMELKEKGRWGADCRDIVGIFLFCIFFPNFLTAKPQAASLRELA